MLHQKLWDFNSDLTEACLNHPFVQGLASGHLDSEAFKRYVGQDAFFLRAFIKAYALCAAKSETLEDTEIFYDLMGGGFEELRLHTAYSQKYHIDYAHVSPYLETLAYTDFLQSTAWNCTLGEILASLAPCMQLYAYLGTELAKIAQPDSPYTDWIKAYSSADFQNLARLLESMLDRFASDSTPVHDTYRYAMQCERNFFAAPLEHMEEKPA